MHFKSCDGQNIFDTDSNIAATVDNKVADGAADIIFVFLENKSLHVSRFRLYNVQTIFW